MADCTRTWNFAGIGGGVATLIPRYAGTDIDVRRVPVDLPEAQRTISGHVAISGTAHPITYTFPHLGWIVTATQRDVIMDGFNRCNRGQRSLIANQAQFFVEDEIEEIEDSNPPERAYVAGTLRVVEPVPGQTTTRHKPIFNCYFLTVPTFKPTSIKTASAPTEQHYTMTCTLGEGDIYYAADQLPPPTITATQVAPLAADSPIGTHFVTFS